MPDDARLDQTVELCDWLLDCGLVGMGQAELLTSYCARLVQIGVPLFRLHATQRAFHPKFGGIGFSWYRDSGMQQERYEHSQNAPDRWRVSPFYAMMKSTGKEMHVDLRPVDFHSEFPVLNELKQAGATAYLATGLMFEEGDLSVPVNPEDTPEGMLISWSSDGPEGFRAADEALLKRTLRPLGLALKSSANRQMGHDLLRVYLGRDPVERVMSGEIQRGSLRTINAVIAYFDLTGFTRLTERTPGDELIAMLNDYFGVAVAAVQEAGGNVLKFMGDGMMAMFAQPDQAEAATAALEVAARLGREMRETNRRRANAGLPRTGYTLALHAGEILYGNIGGENRLDFTVIGPAVNLTARLAGMHDALGQAVVMSQAVASAVPGPREDIVPLGRYMLRGVSEPQELFTLYRPEN